MGVRPSKLILKGYLNGWPFFIPDKELPWRDMATQIVIVDASREQILVAFYYPVPAPKQQSGATDPLRLSAIPGTLTAQEDQDLKDGKLFEFIKSHELPEGTTANQIKPKLLAAYSEFTSMALKKYKELYAVRKFIGTKCDDAGGWS